MHLNTSSVRAKSIQLQSQTRKFVAVTQYIFRQYTKALVSYDDARGFFTGVYLQARFERPTIKSIAQCRLPEIFPDLDLLQPVNLLSSIAHLDPDSVGEFNLHSRVSVRELHVLCALVAHRRPRSIFEIGTYKGGTLANLARNAPAGCRIYSLDIARMRLGNPDIEKVFKDRRVRRIRADSQKFDFNRFHGKIDFIFIDGSHVSPDVDRDSENALRMLAPGGMILWHDYSGINPDVTTCLRHLSRRVHIREIRGTHLAIHLG